MNVADITVIGSGIASTVTLIEVMSKLMQNAPAVQPLTVTVIEKHDELFKGIPYGSRSSVNALTITSVHDFIYEEEQPVFFKWLKDTVSEWSADYRERGGITAARWLENNLPLIEAEDWENIYTPRYLFGNYLHHKLTCLLRVAERQGLAKVEFIKAEAINVTEVPGGLYDVTLENPDKTITHRTARKLVIAAGSSPVRKMYDGSDVVYVNDIYHPSVSDNIKHVQAALAETKDAADRNVLIIGSNASSIELLYLLEGLPELRDTVNKTVVISTSGILPYNISTEVLPEHPIPNLETLKTAGDYTLKTLVDASSRDLKLAVHNGANVDYIATVINNTLKLMEPLGEEAKKEFFGIHGVYLRDMFRRSGPEYKNASQLLIDMEEVTLLKGRYINTTASAHGVLLNYQDTAAGEQHTYPLSFKTIINCSGSDNLNESSSRLMYNLVNSGLCRMNISKKGLEVNERFEAAPNLYIMGPLLGGNMNKLIHFWHLENASRLMYLAPHLADELLAK
ncbi:MAG: hypothetical protein JWQ38_3729 [Flavipsychrobacter sp.]|nr:hypothetical protein [Flavipsychrobacter sp.]